MKSYELIEDEFETRIKMTRGDGSYRIIPTDPANSDYSEYLRYTAWVEAGNNPEDFWSQDDELEMIEVSEPKEEETTEGES